MLSAVACSRVQNICVEELVEVTAFTHQTAQYSTDPLDERRTSEGTSVPHWPI